VSSSPRLGAQGQHRRSPAFPSGTRARAVARRPDAWRARSWQRPWSAHAEPSPVASRGAHTACVLGSGALGSAMGRPQGPGAWPHTVGICEGFVKDFRTFCPPSCPRISHRTRGVGPRKMTQARLVLACGTLLAVPARSAGLRRCRGDGGEDGHHHRHRAWRWCPPAMAHQGTSAVPARRMVDSGG
jgi:hypothetical protein